MVLVTAVYFIVKQHRRRLAQHEATGGGMGRANSRGGQLDTESGRIGRDHAIILRGILSDGALVREPPPAYIPAGAVSWLDNAEGFLVSTVYDPTRVSRIETIIPARAGGRTVGQRSEGCFTRRYRHACRYFNLLDQPRRSRRSRVVDADRRWGAAPLRGCKYVVKLQTPTIRPVDASTAEQRRSTTHRDPFIFV